MEVNTSFVSLFISWLTFRSLFPLRDHWRMMLWWMFPFVLSILRSGIVERGNSVTFWGTAKLLSKLLYYFKVWPTRIQISSRCFQHLLLSIFYFGDCWEILCSYLSFPFCLTKLQLLYVWRYQHMKSLIWLPLCHSCWFMFMVMCL